MSHGYLEWGCWLSVRFAPLSRTFRPPPPPRLLGGGYKGNRGASTHPDCPCKRNSSSIVRLKMPTIIQIILEHPQVVYTIKFNVHSYFSLLFIGSSRGYEQARPHWFPAYKLSTSYLMGKNSDRKNNQYSVSHNPRAACVIKQ